MDTWKRGIFNTKYFTLIIYYTVASTFHFLRRLFSLKCTGTSHHTVELPIAPKVKCARPIYLTMFLSRRYTTHSGCVFYSPLSGFSLLAYEVTWSHTQRRAAIGRTPLNEWSVRRRDLYLTTHNTHNRQTSMPQWDSSPRSQQAGGRIPTP
jgi:hypothetical protein